MELTIGKNIYDTQSISSQQEMASNQGRAKGLDMEGNVQTDNTYESRNTYTVKIYITIEQTFVLRYKTKLKNLKRTEYYREKENKIN
jgi:hypothetical protein